MVEHAGLADKVKVEIGTLSGSLEKIQKKHGGAPLGYVVPALRGGGTKPAYDSLKAVKNSGQ